MNKFVSFAKVHAGYEMLHDGALQVVEDVQSGPLYTTITLGHAIVQRPGDYLAAVRITQRPRSRAARPPLTARLTAEEREWTEAFAVRFGIEPQELVAAALRAYRKEIEEHDHFLGTMQAYSDAIQLQRNGGVPPQQKRRHWWSFRTAR